MRQARFHGSLKNTATSIALISIASLLIALMFPFPIHAQTPASVPSEIGDPRADTNQFRPAMAASSESRPATDRASWLQCLCPLHWCMSARCRA